MGASSIPRLSVPVILLILLSAGSVVAFLFEKHTTAGLHEEIESLRATTNEIQRLRSENEEVVRLRAENQEIEQLRNDRKTLLKLRNEVRQLREEKARWESAQGTNQKSRSLPPNPLPNSPAAAGATAPPPAGTTNSLTEQASRPWIGFYCVKVPRPGDSGVSQSEEKPGALVSLIQPGSPAEKSGLQVDDIVVAINDLEVRTVQDLGMALQKLVIGQEFTLDAIRQGTPLRLLMQVGVRPPGQ